MQKAVLKLELHDDKEKKKVMKKVSGFTGVESIAMDMKDKKLTVVGTMDPVNLVEKLRKLFSAEIVSVGPAKEAPKKDDNKKDNPDKKKDDNKGNKNEQPKDKQPDPSVVYFPHGAYRLPPPQPLYYPGHYQPPPPPTYYYGRSVSVEEDPNACVIC
ncbi:heavy metal-associated isoprenylated plant protein 39 [Eucalyptus grandis]|uniref:heavy metal-associated isoprenylated plant protein 39 n=1 Tax=Eucalyptus grandis TaxID=71139 RepID=UPI00192F05DD|nr:heavy metal-associated isoprenylated plant protein 39 [Eucalyptus grandis]